MQAVQERCRQSVGGILGKPQHNLRLRAVSPDGDVRTLRINSRKYTIGASEACSLRLRGAGLQAVHCLIVRGARGTIVRNLSSGNKLNGQEFTDAQLDPGDRLRLGTFEFLVLPHRRRKRTGRIESRTAASLESSQLPSATLQLTAAIESRMNHLEQQLVGLQRQQTRNKIKKLRRTIERLSDQIENQQVRHSLERRQWETERDNLLEEVVSQGNHSLPPVDLPTESNSNPRSEAMEEELSILSTQLSDAQLQQQASQDQWLAERSHLEQQLQETRTRISALEDELTAFEQTAAGFAAERARYESKTGELTLSLEQLSAQLEQQQSAHHAEGTAWRQARTEIETELGATRLELQKTTQRLAELEKELTCQRSDSAAAAAAFERQRAALQEEQRQLVAQLEVSEEAVRASQVQVEQWERECTALASRAEELEQHIVTLQQATLDSADISDSVEEAASLRREMAVWKQQQEQRQNDWQQERQRLTDQLNSVQQDFADEQQHCRDLEQSAARNAEWAETRDELQAALEVASNKPNPEIADSHLRDLEDQLSKLRAEIDYWKQQAQPENLIADSDVAAAINTVEEVDDADDSREAVWNSQTIAVPIEEERKESADLGGAPVDTATVLALLETPNADVPNAESAHVEAVEPPNEAESAEHKLDEALLASLERTVAAAAATDTQLDQDSIAPPAPGESVGDEDAIEDYMNRLLARVRGDEAPSIVARLTPERAPITEVEIDHELLVEEELPPEAGEFVPRRAAPERTDSLAAMRSLANDSARSAIASHAKRNWMEVAKYQICGVAMGVTGAIVAYVTLENRPIFAAIGVVAGLITAAGFAGQTLAVRRQLLFSSDAGQRADAIEGLDEIEVQFQPESQGGTAALEPHRDVAD